MVLGNVRKAATIVVTALGFLSFFVPMITMQVPVLGRLQFSPLNIVSRIFSDKPGSSPSFSDVTKIGERATKSQDATASSERGDHSGDKVPIAIRLVPFVPLEIVLTYFSLLMILLLALARPVLSKIRTLAVLGLISSSIALISIFLFADAVISTMTESMNSPDMQDNPFAGIGRMLVQSIHIDPGSGIYMLVIAMAIITLVCYFNGLDRLVIQTRAEVSGQSETAIQQ
jgi:hypothetical protein